MGDATKIAPSSREQGEPAGRPSSASSQHHTRTSRVRRLSHLFTMPSSFWSRRRPSNGQQPTAAAGHQHQAQQYSVDTSRLAGRDNERDRDKNESTPRTSPRTSKLLQGFLQRTRSSVKRGSAANVSASKRPNLHLSVSASPVSHVFLPLEMPRTALYLYLLLSHHCRESQSHTIHVLCSSSHHPIIVVAPSTRPLPSISTHIHSFPPTTPDVQPIVCSN